MVGCLLWCRHLSSYPRFVLYDVSKCRIPALRLLVLSGLLTFHPHVQHKQMFWSRRDAENVAKRRVREIYVNKLYRYGINGVYLLDL